MGTLLLRISGPMQSWGTRSRFAERDAGTEPSKSGIIGLLCAALGRPRDAPIFDLLELKLGVRVDREGIERCDFQTAGGGSYFGVDHYGVAKSNKATAKTVISNRYYLSDANFLVGLEGEESLLIELDRALASPVWPLYLGRKSFVPGMPIRVMWRPDHMPGSPKVPGLVHLDVENALRDYPWFMESWRHQKRPPDPLRIVIEVPFGSSSEIRNDVPLSFAERKFMIRNVKTSWMDLGDELVLEGN